MVISGGSVTCAISFSFAACDRRLTLPRDRFPEKAIIHHHRWLLDFVAGWLK